MYINFYMKQIRFSQGYFILFLVLLLLEIGIALFVRDAFIRPYGGDFLVVIMLYCLLKSFGNLAVDKAILLVLSFAFLIEFFQYVNILNLLDFAKSRLLSVVLGNHFEWRDIFIYSLAGLAIFLTERMR